MKRHLFDASSFVKALKLGKPELLIKSHIQWLTLYEIMNALWKEKCLAKAIPVDKALQLMESNLVLVTEDVELKIKAQQLVKTLSIGETSSHQDNNTS